jgi:hypothetical protein
MKHKDDYLERHGTVQEKVEHETRKEVVFRVTKQCLGILLECSFDKVELSREICHSKGGAAGGGERTATGRARGRRR